MNKIVIGFLAVFLFSFNSYAIDTQKLTLESGKMYLESEASIRCESKEVEVTFTGKGTLTFLMKCNYGTLEALEYSGYYDTWKLGSLSDYECNGNWKTQRISFTSSGTHRIKFIGAFDEDYDSGVGAICNLQWKEGWQLPADELYKFEENEDGTLSITGNNVWLQGDISLPASINGKKVTGLKYKWSYNRGGFADCEAITGLTLPATMETIEWNTRLLPNTSTIFTNLMVSVSNTKLRSENNMVLDNKGNLLLSARQTKKSTSYKLQIPSGVTRICKGAFYGMIANVDVVIPEGVTDIEGLAFYGSYGYDVYLPSTLKTVGDSAFGLSISDDDGWSEFAPVAHISNLAKWCEIDFEGEDMLLKYNSYCYINGVQVNHYGLNPFEVPEGVSKIGRHSLDGIGAARVVVVPDTVKTVSASLFADYYRKVEFLGDAPSFVRDTSEYMTAVVLVHQNTNGWGVVPGSWNGVATQYAGNVRFDVALSLGGGLLETDKISVVSNERYGALPTPKKDGYGFVGWYSQASYGTKIESSTIAGKEATLYARWKAITYSISYTNTNGMANGNATSYTVESEIVFKPLSNKEGWNFVRWEPAAIAKGTTGNITVEAIWEEDVPDDPKITIDSNGDSAKAPCRVEITCEKANAKIYYSTNGRTPRIVEDNLYKGPFEIEESKTIIAVAVIGEFQSEYVTREIVVAPLTLADALDDENADVATGGDSKWFVELNSSAKNGKAVVRSGAIGMEQQTWLEMKVAGRGTLSFWWKVSCEPDPRGKYTYDHVEFAENQETKFRLDGETDWAQETIEFETEGEHTVRWTYLTDDWETAGYNDCAWVDCVVWSPIPTPNLPTELEGASEETKAAFDEWVKKHGVQNPSAANVNAFLLGISPDATEEEIQAKVEAEIENIDLSKLATDPAAAVEAIRAKYPNAKVELAPVEDFTTSAHLYKLIINLK